MAQRMVARPNTRVDVFRDADSSAPVVDRDVDPWGDEIETPRDDVPGGSTDEPLHAAEPALIVSESVNAGTDANPRVVRRPIARMRPDIDVREGDRLVDVDGAVYSVDTVTRPRFDLSRLLDVRLELTRVS
jgi:hypothetical protein